MKKPPLKGVNVDEAVAAGAIIYAGLQSKKDLNEVKKAIESVKLQDVFTILFRHISNGRRSNFNRRVLLI